MVERFHLIYFSPEPKREGHASYTHVQEIIHNLGSIGWRVELFCPKYSVGKLPNAFLRFIGIAGALWRTIVALRPNVYYIRWHFAAWPLVLWAKLWQIPTVIEVNGPVEDLFIAWPVTHNFKRVFTWLMKSQLIWSNAIVAVTPGLADLCRLICGDEKYVEVIPNGANINQFCPEASQRDHHFVSLLPEKFVVFFGTMAPWQGIGTILEALEDPVWPRNIHVVFAGDGVERHAVEKAARCVGQVHYLGIVPYEELPAIVSRAKGSLICGENLEGRASTGLAPLKLFESLASGVPAIVTELPYQADVVRNGRCGTVIESGKSSILAKAVANLVEDEDRRAQLSCNARRVAVSEHSWEARARDTDAILRHVLAGKK